MVYKNAVLNIIGSLGSTLFITVGYVLLSRILGPSKMGQYTYAVWMITVCVQLSTGGVPSALAKFIPEFKSKYKNKDINSFALKLILLSFAISIFVSLFLIFIFPHIKNTASYLFYIDLIALNIPFVTLSNLLIGYMQGRQKFNYISSVSIISSVIFSILVIISALVYKNVVFVLVAYLLYSISNFIPLLLLSNIKLAFTKKLNPQMGIVFRYIISVSLLIFFDTIIWDKSEVFFLKRFYPDTQIAFYSISYTLVSKVSYLIPYALTSVLIPSYSSLISTNKVKDSHHVFYKSTKYLALFILPVAFGGAAISAPIINYVLGVQYLGSIGTLRVMFLFSIFGVIASSGSSLMHGMRKQNILLYVSFAVSIVSIALDLIVIPRYASIGAAFANGISQLLGVSISTGYIVYKFNLPFPYIPVLKSFLSAAVMGAFAYAIMLKNNNPFAVICTIVFSGIIYLLLLLVLKTFDKEDKELVANILKFILPASLMAKLV